MDSPPDILLDKTRQLWLRDAGALALFAAFAAAGAEARVVGGAVRNSFLGAPVIDIDFAADRPPEESERILQAAGLKTVRTGFAHGTITAVHDGRGYEITSLRRDVTGDGRHAEVAYTDDWQADAARRDFTMNALYADATGRIYDYHGGAGDLHAGRVRFIGDANARIEEDYLRILRFFRFHAWYGRGAADEAALAACTAAAGGMNILSRERVTQEWLKLLRAPDPVPALELMRTHGVLAQVLPLEADVGRLRRLLDLGEPAYVNLRFAALLPDDAQLGPVLNAALRLPQRDLRAVLDLCDPARAVPTQAKDLPRALYRYGADTCQARLLLQAANGMQGWRDLLPAIDGWQMPRFPLTGDDLLKIGVPSSPELGALLTQVEEWWIAGGFSAGRKECLDEAKNLMKDMTTR